MRATGELVTYDAYMRTPASWYDRTLRDFQALLLRPVYMIKDSVHGLLFEDDSTLSKNACMPYDLTLKCHHVHVPSVKVRTR